IDLEKFPPGDEHFEFPSLFSIGAMDWMPNSEGIRWFLDEVWPLIHEKFPDLPYYIAGRHMPDWLTRCRRANVKVVGEVECARDFMHSKAIMIVPLLSGSGIRIKIIEGMAAGKCIVSTSIGAEGIHYEDGKNIKIADSPEAFADAVSVLMDKESCLKMGREARKLIENEYRSDQIIAKLTSFYQKTGS
ncbi:MAG: glycosyltransferase family 4 protein, partial [Syntrophothermus sp.]